MKVTFFICKQNRITFALDKLIFQTFGYAYDGGGVFVDFASLLVLGCVETFLSPEVSSFLLLDFPV